MFFNHEIIDIESIIPFAMNSRLHSDAQVAQLAASIREFGFTNPVLIDQEKNLIAGHGRVMAARKLGLASVPAIVVTGLDERKRRALVIADNKLAMNATWDDEVLKNELSNLAGDFGELMGFSEDELAKIAVLDINFLPGTEEDQSKLDEKAPIICPSCHHEFHK